MNNIRLYRYHNVTKGWQEQKKFLSSFCYIVRSYALLTLCTALLVYSRTFLVYSRTFELSERVSSHQLMVWIDIWWFVIFLYIYLTKNLCFWNGWYGTLHYIYIVYHCYYYCYYCIILLLYYYNFFASFMYVTISVFLFLMVGLL